MNASKAVASVCVLIVVFATSANASPWTCSPLDRTAEDKNFVLDINNIVEQHQDTRDNHASVLSSFSSSARERQNATIDVTAYAADNSTIWSSSSHVLPHRRTIWIMLSYHGATAASLIGICDRRLVESGDNASDGFHDEATWISSDLPCSQTIHNLGATGNSIVGGNANSANPHESNSSTPEPVGHSLAVLGSVTLSR